jgi:predicted CopG family antitoxin
MGRFLRAIFGRKRASSSFSDFIRNASSAEKKKVYTEVLKKATARQNELTRKIREQSRAEVRPHV